jgi:hypothetical protein
VAAQLPAPDEPSSIIHLLLHVVIQKSGVRLSTVVTILVLGHEASDSRHGRVLSQACHLSVGFYSVIFEGLHGNGLVCSLHLLGASVNLLLALFTPTAKTKHQVKSGFLLNIVITQSASIFQLLSGKDETLLIRWNSLLILDLGLDIVNGIGWFDIQCDSLACEIEIGTIIMVSLTPSYDTSLLQVDRSDEHYTSSS